MCVEGTKGGGGIFATVAANEAADRPEPLPIPLPIPLPLVAWVGFRCSRAEAASNCDVATESLSDSAPWKGSSSSMGPIGTALTTVAMGVRADGLRGSSLDVVLLWTLTATARAAVVGTAVVFIPSGATCRAVGVVVFVVDVWDTSPVGRVGE